MTQSGDLAARGRRVVGLVRHGHFDRPERQASAHSLLPLSERGREQARDAADRVLELCAEHGLSLDGTVETSQLLRAWETARLLGERLGERTGSAPRLFERAELLERGLGAAANLRFEQIEALIAADPRLEPLPTGWRRIPEFRLPVPGAESLMQAGARAATRIASSMKSFADDDPRDVLRLFVAHAGCLRHAAVQLGCLDVRVVAGLTMDHGQVILIELDRRGEWVQLAGQWRKRVPEAESAGS